MGTTMGLERYDDEPPPAATAPLASRRALGAWLERYWVWLAIVAVAVIGTGLVAAYVQRPQPPPVVIFQPTPRATPSPPPTEKIAVHVSGAVASPGLYRLPIGSRIDDAVKAAGGALPDADLNRLNLAARLADGQQVVVQARPAPASAGSPGAGLPGASPPDGAGSSVAGRVNVNTASIPELDSLPGVGPVTAQRIVAHREQHGRFARVEQLREAKLVNNATFERIKDLVATE